MGGSTTALLRGLLTRPPPSKISGGLNHKNEIINPFLTSLASFMSSSCFKRILQHQTSDTVNDEIPQNAPRMLKWQNRYNFSKTYVNDFIFGQKLNINKENTFWRFGGVNPAWRHFMMDDVIFPILGPILMPYNDLSYHKHLKNRIHEWIPIFTALLEQNYILTLLCLSFGRFYDGSYMPY